MEQTLELQVVDTNTQLIDKEGNVTLQNLTPTDASKYELIAANIEENNPNSVINFGAELQNTLASQSDSFLNNVRKSNSGEVGELINKLLVELNYVDVDELEGNSFKKFLRDFNRKGQIFLSDQLRADLIKLVAWVFEGRLDVK